MFRCWSPATADQQDNYIPHQSQREAEAPPHSPSAPLARTSAGGTRHCAKRDRARRRDLNAARPQPPRCPAGRCGRRAADGTGVTVPRAGRGGDGRSLGRPGTPAAAARRGEQQPLPPAIAEKEVSAEGSGLPVGADQGIRAGAEMQGSHLRCNARSNPGCTGAGNYGDNSGCNPRAPTESTTVPTGCRPRAPSTEQAADPSEHSTTVIIRTGRETLLTRGEAVALDRALGHAPSGGTETRAHGGRSGSTRQPPARHGRPRASARGRPPAVSASPGAAD